MEQLSTWAAPSRYTVGRVARRRTYGTQQPAVAVHRGQAQKRGGQFAITSIRTDVGAVVADAAELTRISDALDELATVDDRLSRIVDLKFFCGFSFVEIAA